MKTLTLSLMLLLCIQACFCQILEKKAKKEKKYISETEQNVDMAKKDSTYTIGFRPLIFKKLVNQQFSSLLTGKINNGIGNYADLDIADGEVSFQGTYINKSGSVFAVKAAGGIDDGLFSVFDHSKLNSNLSLEFQYNFLSLKNKQLSFKDRSFRNYRQGERKARLAYREQKLLLDSNHLLTILRTDSLLLSAQKQKLNIQNNKLKLVLDSIHKKLISYEKDTQLKYKLLKDSISYNIAQIDYRLDTLQHVIKDQTRLLAMIQDNDNNNDKVAKIDALLDTVDISGFKFGWFSISYKVKATDFKLFSEAGSFLDQVRDDNFIGHEARFQWSYYKWSDNANKSWFFDAGALLSFSDNLADLKKLELVEEKQYGLVSGDRKSVNKYNVYSGEYKDNLLGLKLYMDMYHFFFNDNIMAIHIYPEYDMKRNLKPVFNTGIGLLFSFKDNKKDKALVNAELYYNFLDVFKTTDVEYRLFERNNIGVRFVLPLAFKSYK